MPPPRVRSRKLPHPDYTPGVPPAIRAMASEDGRQFHELEPHVSLIWCEDHVAWHRVHYTMLSDIPVYRTYD